MANCIKLKLPGLDERDNQDAKAYCLLLDAKDNMLILLRLEVQPLFNTNTRNINTTTVTTITTVAKAMKVKFSWNLEGGR